MADYGHRGNWYLGDYTDAPDRIVQLVSQLNREQVLFDDNLPFNPNDIDAVLQVAWQVSLCNWEYDYWAHFECGIVTPLSLGEFDQVFLFWYGWSSFGLPLETFNFLVNPKYHDRIKIWVRDDQIARIAKERCEKPRNKAEVWRCLDQIHADEAQVK
jgi:hypothetical protein